MTRQLPAPECSVYYPQRDNHRGTTIDNARKGFTLIELSIVLVIIGLIVGGVLVGRDLIKSAEVRAQVSQIEKLNQAVNAFRGKFNAVPGDMVSSIATQFGFVVGALCLGTEGSRDGNGLIHGNQSPYLYYQGEGETHFFWQDLSSNVAGNLIEGTYPGPGGAQPICYQGGAAVAMTSTSLSRYFPPAKMGSGNYIYVFEKNGANWYSMSNISSVDVAGQIYSTPTIQVAQAYALDKKVDDGLPAAGNVQTNYLNGNSTLLQTAPNTATSGGTSTSCFDTTTGTYSITQNNGAGANCALSFKFQ